MNGKLELKQNERQKLRWKAKKASFRGVCEPSVRYHSKRAITLTLCQDLWVKEPSQANNFYRA
ncbi:hypothetical protein EJ110_NYTH14650 [Nymphaea thermarum]|nr:hypothetical protein EJ110_NYTH14650 [Nymphaea thermarum]